MRLRVRQERRDIIVRQPISIRREDILPASLILRPSGQFRRYRLASILPRHICRGNDRRDSLNSGSSANGFRHSNRHTGATGWRFGRTLFDFHRIGYAHRQPALTEGSRVIVGKDDRYAARYLLRRLARGAMGRLVR